MSWILRYLASHPHVQHKLREEISDIFTSDELLFDDMGLEAPCENPASLPATSCRH